MQSQLKIRKPNLIFSQEQSHPSKSDFLDFFKRYYKEQKNVDYANVKEVASKLASNYLKAQITRPRYAVDYAIIPKIKRADVLRKQQQAIEVAKAKFKLKQTKPILPPKSYSTTASRSCPHTFQQQSVTSAKIYKQPQLLYEVGEGNNHQLVKELMGNRKNWIANKDPAQKLISFRWQETEVGFEYRTLVLNKVDQFQLLNHFEFHSEVSNKYNLANNLKAYCEKHTMNIHDIIPTTFVIDCTNSGMQGLQPFLAFYKLNALDHQKMHMDKLGLRPLSKAKPITDKTKELYPTLYGPEHLWIFKPANMNQGRGIHLITNIQQILDLFKSYQKGYKEKLLEVERDHNNEIVNQVVYHNTLSCDKFVIQKYIERPLLIQGRKFDVRVYALLTMNLQLYFCSQGQLRLATEVFDLTTTSHFIHLTNNAVQYNHSEYGKQEDGNQYTFDQASKYFNFDFNLIVINRIKELTQCIFQSARTKINKYKRKFCFEIFGLDFIVDEAHKPWLIEVNSNPSYEATSKYLAKLFPQLIDDALKLTLDQLFNTESTNNTQQLSSNNVWEYIGVI